MTITVGYSWRAATRICLFLAILALPFLAFGQFSSNIQGVVSDPSGAVVPGAHIRLTNLETSAVQNSVSGADGVYHFVSLGAGHYQLKSSAQGFSGFLVDVQLTTGQTLDVPIRLVVGSQQQTVEVTGQQPNLDTAETRSQDTLSTTALSTLPMGDRSLFPLITLAPGVQGLGTDLLSDEGSSTANFSPQITFDISANGRGPGANMFVVDGLDVTSDIADGALNLTPNPDSVQEVSIQTDTFSTEYGRASSLEVLMTTKSGTEKYHGSASDYFTYQGLWAGTEFVHSYAPFHSNDMSGTLGGPVPHVRGLFFFGSVEPHYALTATGNQAITYEAPEFTNFAQQNFPNTLGTKLLATYRPSGATTTGVASTAADIFPTTCGTPAAANIPCSLPVVDSGIFNAADYMNGLQFNTRIDKQFKNDRLYGNFYRMGMTSGGPAVRSDMATSNAYNTNSLQVNETHTISENTLNEVAFGFNRVQGTNNQTGPFQVPVVNVIGSSSGIGIGFADGGYIQHNYRWRDVLTHIAGNHTIKVGYEGWRGDDLALFAPVYAQPSFTFTNLLNLAQDQPFSETNLAYNPLSGTPAKGQYMFGMNTNGAFYTDIWRATNRLTVTYGVRWDDYGNAYPMQGTVLANFFLGSGQNFDQQIANGSMIQKGHVMNQAPWSFTPRVGAAWDITGHGDWVLRGGVGVYHDWPSLGQDENELKGNPPGWVIPNFIAGTTTAPIFGMGSTSNYPYGFPYPQFTATGLDSQGGLVGEQPSVGGVDPNLRAPNTYNYTATLARALGHNFVVSAGYAGSRSTGLISGSDGAGTQTYGTDINHYAGDLIQHNDVLTRLNPSFGSITYSMQQSSARYNAAIFAIKGTFAKTGYIDASYTRSSAYDNGQIYPTAVLSSQYWGPSPYDAPNRLSMMENYVIPLPGRHNSFVSGVLEKWGLSSATIFQTGYPFTVYTSAPFQPIQNSQGQVIGMQPGSGDYNADGDNYDFPNIAPGGYKTQRSRRAFLSGMFSSGQFQVPTMGTEGNELSDRFRSPNFEQTDFGITKTNRVKENLDFQFRCEFFNVFNRVNLTNVSSDLSTATFGTATSQSSPRWVQFSGKLTF